MTRARRLCAGVTLLFALAPSCSLNPQPMPPGDVLGVPLPPESGGTTDAGAGGTLAVFADAGMTVSYDGSGAPRMSIPPATDAGASAAVASDASADASDAAATPLPFEEAGLIDSADCAPDVSFDEAGGNSTSLDASSDGGHR